MDTFSKSALEKNTIIVFTTDHCTYNAEDFREVFPDYPRYTSFLDRIPFAIYYDSVIHEDIDAYGRNSLDMAPTLLDLVGVSAPNYFLGSSLYNQYYGDSIETIYWADEILTSAAGVPCAIDGQRYATFMDIVSKYFVASQQTP